MAKKSKSKNKPYKANWKNKTLVKLVNHFMASDGKLTKQQIISIGNEKLYKNLRSGGYLVNKDNDLKSTFEMSGKLRKSYDNNCKSGIEFRGSGGEKHAKYSYTSMKLIPKAVIDEGRFQSEATMKEEFKQFKKTQEFRNNLEKIINEKEKAIKNSNDKEKIKALKKEIQLLHKREFSVCDLRVQVTKEEAREFLDNIEKHISVTHHTKRDRYKAMHRKLDKLIQSTQGNTMSISIEIDSGYSGVEKMKHENYESVTNEPTIYMYG